jgi:threonine synthase
MLTELRCSRCDHRASIGSLGRCRNCDGILQPGYDDAAIAQLAARPRGRGIERYRPVLPVSTPILYLGEGDTPLIRSRRIGPAFGLDQLYFKVEGRNPSGAFKDRAAALVAALALEAKASGVLTASSGNAAAAISAYSAAAGLKCVILLEPGNPPNKLRQALATGAHVLPVKGIFANGPLALQRMIFNVAQRLNYYPAFIWAPVNPYILEAIKTISYEVVDQLHAAPDAVICPVGGGDLFTAQWRGYKELQRAGMIDHLPRMIAVQSNNAPPLLEAFRSGADHVATLPYANSKISGINVPFTGEHALAAAKESRGAAVGIDDEAAFDMQRRIGVEEGLWVEPAGAAPVAALAQLIQQKLIAREERIVCVLSGAGFKDTHLAQDAAEMVVEREPTVFDADVIV